MKKAKPDKEINLSQDFDKFSSFLENVDQCQEDEGDISAENVLPIHVTDDAGYPISFLHPQSKDSFSPTYLYASSIEVLDLLRTKDLAQRNLETFTAPVALPGNILARRDYGKKISVEQDSEEEKSETKLLEPGSHVRRDNAGNYIAERYGFVVIKKSRLTIVSPLRVEKQGLWLEWLVTADHPVGLRPEMLVYWIKKAGLIGGQSCSPYINLIEKITEGTLLAGAYKLIEGEPPIHGKDSTITWHITDNRSSGQLLNDGRVDFKEQNFVTSVTAGMVLAELHPGTEGVDGKDIFGNKLMAKSGKKLHLFAGKNVREEQSDTAQLFIAEIDGVISISRNRIEVLNVLTVDGDVNFETGNIDFSGSVIIKGSLKNGFTVQAEGDIFVAENVENNARLKADGNIIVGDSINGKGTVVKAGHSVKAKIINQATVFAGNDLEIVGYAYFAKLRALGTVKVSKSLEKLSGGIVGGETWATEKIDTYIAGTEAWVKTELVAGILPEQVKQLDKLNTDIGNRSLHLRQILDYFGMVEIDLKQLQKMIEAAQGAERKRMAIRAKTLANTGKLLQELIADKKRLIAELGPAPENAQICIRESLYPNVIISIGASRQKQNNASGPVRFYQANEQLKTGPLEEESCASSDFDNA